MGRTLSRWLEHLGCREYLGQLVMFGTIPRVLSLTIPLLVCAVFATAARSEPVNPDHLRAALDAAIAEETANLRYFELRSDEIEKMRLIGSGKKMEKDQIAISQEARIGPDTASTKVILYASLDCKHCGDYFGKALELFDSLEGTRDIQFIFRMTVSTRLSALASAIIQCRTKQDGRRSATLFSRVIENRAEMTDMDSLLRSFFFIGAITSDEARACITPEHLETLSSNAHSLLDSCTTLDCPIWKATIDGKNVSVGSYAVPIWIIDRSAASPGYIDIEDFASGAKKLNELRTALE